MARKKKRKYDQIAARVGKAGELLADRQTSKELTFVERPVIDDQKINVLVMGASGAGKSTLINAVLGEERAKVGDGAAVTKKIKVFERADLAFRMIDTPGLEYSVVKQEKIRRELSGWSEEGLSRKNLNKLIHVIWFCIDAQSKRVSNESLDYLYRISKLWKGVPIVVVFTKSFSTAAIRDNEAMFRKVMKRYRKRKKLNVEDVVSVVAKELVLDRNMTVQAYGVEELIEATQGLIPAAQAINATVMENMSVKMRRDAASKYVTAAKRSAFTVAVLPTKQADEEYIAPIKASMLDNVAKAYVLDDDEKAALQEQLETARLVGKLGDRAAALTKRIPLFNGVIAYQVTGALGRTGIRAAEKLYKAREE